MMRLKLFMWVFILGVLLACGDSLVVQRYVTVEATRVVTVEVETEVEVEVEKVVTVEVEVEVTPEPTETPEGGVADEAIATTNTAGSASTTASQSFLPPPATSNAQTVLEDVKARGFVRCGGNGDIPGFSLVDEESGEWSGFDIDFCRALAAAVLGNADAIEVIRTTSTTRFPVLKAGEVDVLFRNTTWTLKRDVTLELNFGPINFHDVQGLMVRTDSEITTLDGLDGETICTATGGTSKANLEDVIQFTDLEIELVEYDSEEDTREAYIDGECTAFSSDSSALLAQRILLDDPENHIVFTDNRLPREPLAPAVRHGDDQWYDIVTWLVLGLIRAEELGVTSDNVEELAKETDKIRILKLLGQDDRLGEDLGLENDFMIEVLKQVGNYGEIYDRHLGPDTPFNLARGLNGLLIDGGLMWSPPFR